MVEKLTIIPRNIEGAFPYSHEVPDFLGAHLSQPAASFHSLAAPFSPFAPSEMLVYVGLKVPL